MSDFEPAPDAEELARTNPRVDREQLASGQEAIAVLRRAGFTRPSYGIESPYERSEPFAQPEATVDEAGKDYFPLP